MLIKKDIRTDSYQTSTNYSGMPQRKSVVNETTSSAAMEMQFQPTLPHNLYIFDEVESTMNNIDDVNIKKQVIRFIAIFKHIVAELNRNSTINNNLPKLRLRIMDDGSVLIHWNYRSLRMGFAFEKELEESSYYIVADQQITGSYFSKSGPLKMEHLEVAIEELLEFILETT